MVSFPRNSWKTLLGFLVTAAFQSSGFSQGVVDTSLNLLTNGDFKNGTTGWTVHAWGSQGQVSVVEPGKVLVDGLKPQALGQAAPDPTDVHEGKPSVKIENPSPDTTIFKQKVKVKPATRYRLSGWVKTKGVEAKQMKGKPPGASLCITGGFEKTENIIRTKGWTHLTFDFSSGTRSEMEVGPALGYYSSPVKGAAWFSEVSLVELGPAH
jgi:hypothetical protein